jgi:hypothetical protein
MNKLVLLVVVLFGCEKTNPYYCKDNLDHNCLLDGSGSGAACTSASQCTQQGLGVCDLSHSPGTCVQCTTGEHSACGAMTPVCGPDDMCHGCATHADCGTNGACLPDGSCGTDANTAWVAAAPAGSDMNACTMEAPCLTISTALSNTTKPNIKVSGMISDNPSITRNVTILADQGAKLVPKNINPLVQLVTPGVTAEIDDLTLAGGMPAAVSITANATVVLQRLDISNNGGLCIDASGGGNVSVQRSKLHNCTGGGISLASMSFDIENNFIYLNGSAGSSFGGVSVYMLGTNPQHTLQFNTITANDGMGGSSTGVACAQTFPMPTFTNNIVYNNTVSNGGMQIFGSCSFDYSDVGPNVTPPTPNSIDADPKFVAGGYHIQTTSPAKDTADPNAVQMFDIDGDRRPINMRRDMGADETP